MDRGTIRTASAKVLRNRHMRLSLSVLAAEAEMGLIDQELNARAGGDHERHHETQAEAAERT